MKYLSALLLLVFSSSAGCQTVGGEIHVESGDHTALDALLDYGVDQGRDDLHGFLEENPYLVIALRAWVAAVLASGDPEGIFLALPPVAPAE